MKRVRVHDHDCPVASACIHCKLYIESGVRPLSEQSLPFDLTVCLSTLPLGDAGEYISESVWQSRKDFDAWRDSQKFQQAHGGEGKVCSHSTHYHVHLLHAMPDRSCSPKQIWAA